MVTSRPLDAAVVNGARLVPVAIWIKRLFAFGLIGLSLLGTAVWMNGGQWGVPSGDLLLYAILYQAVFSVAQFALRAQWQSVWYLGAVAGSVVPSVLSYGARYHSAWVELFAPRFSQDIAGWLAWVALAIALALADIIPEQILVRR